MPVPSTFSEAIAYLNPFKESPAQLLEALCELLQSHAEWAASMIPIYARYFTATEFDLMSQRLPAVSPLLNGYRQLGNA